MENNKKEEFIKELKTLLEKYDVNIGFVCDPCSDTNGIYEAGLEVCENKTGKQVLRTHGWNFDANNLKIN